MNALKVLPLIVIIILSCNGEGSKSFKNEENIGTTNLSALEKDPLIAYTTFINSLDTTNAAIVSIAAAEFEQVFSPDTDTLQADSGFALFNGFYNKVTNSINEQHIKNPSKFGIRLSDKERKNSGKPQNAEVEKLMANGFSIAMSEGNTYLKQDRTFIAKAFYPYVSSGMKEYLLQLNKENEEGFIEDAGLVITPLNLAKRVIFWETFLKKYPSFTFTTEIVQSQKANLTFLLEGIDNTPLMDRSGHKICKNYQTAFEYLLQMEPHSQIASLIKPYYKALTIQDKKAINKLLKEFKTKGLIYDYTA